MSFYNVNIPQGTDPTLQSASQLRANFQAINAAFADNHIGLTQDPELAGMHSQLTLRPQGGNPVTSATQIAIYQKLVAGVPELFYAPSSSQTPIQMTYPSIKADSSNTQYSFAAGPFIIYGGFIPAAINGQTVTLTPGTTLIHVDLTIANLPVKPNFITMAAPTSIAGTTFTISFPGGLTIPIYYFAVGI